MAAGDPSLPMWPGPLTGHGETFRHRPLIALVPALLLGLAAGAAWPGHRWAGLLLCLTTLVWTAGCLHRQRPARFSPLLLWLATGYLAIQPWLNPHPPSDHIALYADGGVRTVTGLVVEQPRLSGHRYRARIQVHTLSAPSSEKVRTVQGDLRLTWSVDEGGLQRGDQIRFAGRLRRIRSFSNPGGFDYARYMAFQGLLVSAYARRHTLTVLTPAEAPGWWKNLLQYRLDRFADLVRSAGATSQRDAVTPLLETLLMGRRHGLTTEMRDPYNRSGVAHLLAISGLHLGAVGAFSFVIFNALLSLVPSLRWRGWVGRTAAALAVAPVVGYALLAGLPVSTQRAAMMMAILMAAILIQRRSDSYNTLCLAAMVILFCHPPALFSISFQLSFGAVAAILYGLKCSGDWWRRGRPGPFGLRHRLRLLALVSALAYVGTAPLVAHYFNLLSLVALPANLILVPWVSFLILPVGLIGLLLSLCNLPGAVPLLIWCAHHLSAVDLMVNLLAGFDWAALDTITPSGFELLLLYTLLILLPCAFRSLRAKVAIACLGVLLGGDIAYWTYTRHYHPHLRITAVDVGQGGSSLVELPGGKTLLIDGGGFSDNRSFDVGRRVLTPLLGRKKIRTIDLMILTHPNSDHLNGLLYLLRHFNVGQLWRNLDAPQTAGFAELCRRIAQEGIPSPSFEALPRHLRLGKTDLELLHPPRFYARHQVRRRTNDNSLVLKLTHGEHSFLWPGDLGQRAERELIDRLPAAALAATVLYAPHHGSRSSSSSDWVAAVAPREVVFSVGWQNPYRFPHPEVAERYRRQGARLWRTDLDGAIRFISDGRTLRLDPTRPRLSSLR